MQSETGFPSSHQWKSYVASKSRLKLAARAVLSADAGLLVDYSYVCNGDAVAACLNGITLIWDCQVQFLLEWITTVFLLLLYFNVLFPDETGLASTPPLVFFTFSRKGPACTVFVYHLINCCQYKGWPIPCTTNLTQLSIGGALCESSVIPFLVPCRNVWLMAAARVPCSNAANVGECKTSTQSELCSWQNSVMSKSPQKCIYSIPVQETAKHHAKFGWPPVSDVAAVTKPRHETRWDLLGCPKLANSSQPLVGQSSPYCKVIGRRYCHLILFSYCWYVP